MKRKLLSAQTILPISSKPLSNSSVFIEDGKIVEIGPTADLIQKYEGVRHTDLGKGILLPGFINAHTHLELGCITEHIGGFDNFTDWIKQIISAKRDHAPTDRQIRNSVNNGIRRLIKSGTTTVAEISSFDGADKEPLKNCYLRTIIFSEVFDRHLDDIKDIELEKSELYEERLFPHAPYSCSPQTISEVQKHCQKSGNSFGIHLAESKQETLFINNKNNYFEQSIYPILGKEKFSRKRANTPIEYMVNNNFFDGVRVSTIHMIHVLEQELQLIKENEIGVILCPRSNKFLNTGLPPVKLYKELDRIGLGTDGVCSNLNLDMFEEISFFYLTYFDDVGPEMAEFAVYAATLGGARALFIEDEVGSIEPGKAADMIFINPQNYYRDPYLSVVSSTRSELQMSMVNGEILFCPI
ncbi:MAG: amidohydrolase family protein [Candidatus Dadabacteria bacterium]|nr:amidohydrolase family protein [Candidatus Dadabacteria bacterium]